MKREVGKRLQKLRKQRSLTQKEAGKQAGINPTTLSGYEIAKNEPNLQNLQKLSELYQVSIDYIVTGRNRTNGDEE